MFFPNAHQIIHMPTTSCSTGSHSYSTQSSGIDSFRSRNNNYPAFSNLTTLNSNASSSSSSVNNVNSPLLSEDSPSLPTTSAESPGATESTVTTTKTNVKKRKAAPKEKGKKKNLLTEEEKRANHIDSEKRRRSNIKNGLDQLCALVPGLKDSKSEALVMTKSMYKTNYGLYLNFFVKALEYIDEMLQKENDLKEEINRLSALLGEEVHA